MDFDLTEEFNHLSFLSTKPRKGDLKKLEIVKAAIDCISTIGYEKTTYEAIAKKLGTRRAHIAYHFNNKEDIFKACIHFINHEYQVILYDKMKEAEDPKEMILLYSDAPFIWAKKYPKYLDTMLLFYYLCGINKEYKKLNNEIRRSGRKRIISVLQHDLKINAPMEKLETFALVMQNLMSGSILDSATTKDQSLEQAKQYTRNHILQMLSELERV